MLQTSPILGMLQTFFLSDFSFQLEKKGIKITFHLNSRFSGVFLSEPTLLESATKKREKEKSQSPAPEKDPVFPTSLKLRAKKKQRSKKKTAKFQQKIQQFLTKILRLETGAKECIE